MLDRDAYPPGVPCWVDTEQPDPDAAADFYAALFGWSFDDRSVPGEDQRYLVAQVRGKDVAGIGSPTGTAAPPVWHSYVWVDSADQAATATVQAGGSVLVEPFDVGKAGRMAVLGDLSGAAICAWQPREHKGAQVVNEHGAWNFSHLATPDLEKAKAFYGAVFGWIFGDMGAGDGSGFWRMPGYGGPAACRRSGWRRLRLLERDLRRRRRRRHRRQSQGARRHRSRAADGRPLGAHDGHRRPPGNGVHR